MDSNGIHLIWIFISLFIYAGSMQFIAASLITSGLIPNAFIITLMVNARHLYSISMLENTRDGKIESLSGIA